MQQDLSIISLIENSNLIVQLVMLLLLSISVLSWALIFHKRLQLKHSSQRAEKFELHFWSGASINEMYQELNQEKRLSAQEIVFIAGMREIVKHQTSKLPLQNSVDSVRRAMMAACQREVDYLESSMSILASIASVSPYIGLFGTVWGIMHAFTGLANLQQVTLATVAPGIAEALVATATGLFAAIPAVVAYNFFNRNIEKQINHIDSFMDDFSNILQRHSAPQINPMQHA